MEDNKLSLRWLLGENFHPLQRELITSPEFEIAAVTGMGSGKTYAGCVAAVRHGAKYPGARVLIARFTYDELIKTTKHTFFELVKNKDLVSYFDRPRVWDVREGTNYARMKNGSEFFFTNLEKNLDKHKNVEYSLEVIDQAEELPYEIIELLRIRCRLNVVPPTDRHCLYLANDEGDNWLRRRFLTYEAPHGRPTAGATRRLVRGTSLENPHLDEGIRQQYLALPPELQKRWVFAPMEAGSSRLIPDMRVIPHFDPPAHWPRWMGIDPARSTGVTCALWVTVNPDKEPYKGVRPNSPYFYQEYWAEGRDAEDHSREMDRMNSRFIPRAQIMDQTAWHAAIRSKKLGAISVADLYIQAGLSVAPSSGDEWTRVMLFIHAHRRGLMVSEQCKNLIRQAPEYRLKGQMGAFGPLKINAKQRFHAVDAGGYALSAVPSRVIPVDIREIRDAFDIPDHIDEGSRLHWTEFRRQFPKMKGRESVVSWGTDEMTEDADRVEPEFAEDADY